jgi:hypothetical protein
MGMEEEFIYVPIPEGKKVTGVINDARLPSRKLRRKF